MMSFVRVIFLIVVFGSISSQVEARSAPVFFGWGGENISLVTDFPNTADFQTVDGKYVDAGVIYKQLTLFFLPAWNYDIRWVGYIGSDIHYVQLDRTKLEDLAQNAGLALPQEPSLPGWDAYGGKVILLLMAALVVFVTTSRG